MLSDRISESKLNSVTVASIKNKDHDELSTIQGVDDEVPDLRDCKEFLNETSNSNNNNHNNSNNNSNTNTNIIKYTESLGLEIIHEDKEFKFDPSDNFIFTDAPVEEYSLMNTQITEATNDNNYPTALAESNVRL